ncbi:MAG TPA: ATP synthase F0 subunit B [Candidatus Limnocylindrales bacterium]|nr:ATP synthase F0 subunit B [Candidatus Limnocylindrales bacterium]
MATEQRTGFRLPWTPDARIGAVAKSSTQATPEHEADPDGSITTPVPSTPEATEMQEATELTDPRGDLAWPELGEGGQPSTDASAGEDPAAVGRPATVTAAPTPKRRDNPLVAGLVRAMRDAAATARTESATRFTESAKARIEAIHAESADEAADLRKNADAEIQEIRDWSKAEMARIREETDDRIASRKQRLEAEVQDHAARVEHRIDRVQAAVTDFERRMDGFFEQLLAEEDPARVAALAEQLPEPPALDAADLDDWVPAPAPTLDARGAAEAEAEAFAGLDAVDPDLADADPNIDPDDQVEPIGEADVIRRLETFAPSAPATDTATSRVAVVGLVSVASIAGFKRAIARIAGVRSVTVASGPSGEFVFSINHDPETDLASAVPALEGFRAAITGEDDGVLTVTASDPETVK